jgi:hypothetical protein
MHSHIALQDVSQKTKKKEVSFYNAHKRPGKKAKKESNVLATTAMIGGILYCNLIIELSTILKDPKAVQKCSLLVNSIG